MSGLSAGSTTSVTIAQPKESNQTLTPPLNPNDSYDITVTPIGTANPVVSRRLCVPAHIWFHELSTIIQIAFDLRGKRDWQFNISHPGAWPVEESNAYPLQSNEHYRDCRERDFCYFTNFVPRVEWKRQRTRMGARAFIHDSDFWGIGHDEENRPIEYWYVYGIDRRKEGGGWLYRITVNGMVDLHDMRSRVDPGSLASDQRTFCVDGEGHPIAENCKGPKHWQALKDACRVPSRAEDTYRSAANRRVVWRNKEDQLRHFFEKECINGHSLWPDGLIPRYWDKNAVNVRLYEFRLLPERERDRPARLRSKFLEMITGQEISGLSWREAWYGVEPVNEPDT